MLVASKRRRTKMPVAFLVTLFTFVTIFPKAYLSPIKIENSKCESFFLTPESKLLSSQSLNENVKCSNFYFPQLQCESTISTSDPRYDEMRRHPNNLRHRSDAAFIVLPKDAKEIEAILTDALTRNLRPTVRSGGHCYEDFWANNSGGVLIDLQMMNKIYQSPNDSTIWIEPGTILSRAYDVLYKEYGLTMPAGSCYSLGLGGHVAGGGYGCLTRKYGLVIDYVDSIEVVTINENRTVQTILVGRNSTNEKEKHLFWALRGGGPQNFGIMTKFGFKNLPKSPALVYKYDATWKLEEEMSKERFEDFIDKWTRFYANNSGVDSEYCDIAFMGATIGRRKNETGYLTINLCVMGNKRALVDKLLESVGFNSSEVTEKFTCQEMSYYRFAQVSGSPNEVGSDGVYYAHRSAYMANYMPHDQIENVWYYFTDPSYSYVTDAYLQLRGYGCAVSKWSMNDMAYAHRRAVVKMQYAVNWRKPEEAESHYNWSRNFYRAMYGAGGPKANNVTDGCNINYPDKELVDWQHLYFKSNYEKLQMVKKEWDPLNIFRHRQSVELPNF